MANSVNGLRLLLMLLAKNVGDDDAVDRIAGSDDPTILRIARLAPGARTFASEHQDGESWETSGRFYRREDGETHRVPNPDAPEESSPESEGQPKTTAIPTPTPEPKPESEPAPKDESSQEDEGSHFDAVLGLIGDTPEERAATVISRLALPLFPESRQRLEEGLTEFFGGNHDVVGIIEKQCRKLAADENVPSPERAVFGAVADFGSGKKGLGDAILDNLKPVKESLHGKKLAMNLIEGATLALAAYAPGVGTVIGGAIDETARQLVEEGETNWQVIAKEAAKAAVIGLVTRRLGRSARKGSAKLAKKVGKVAGRLGETAGTQAEKWANRGAEVAVNRGEEALKHRAQQALLDPRVTQPRPEDSR